MIRACARGNVRGARRRDSLNAGVSPEVDLFACGGRHEIARPLPSHGFDVPRLGEFRVRRRIRDVIADLLAIVGPAAVRVAAFGMELKRADRSADAHVTFGGKECAGNFQRLGPSA